MLGGSRVDRVNELVRQQLAVLMLRVVDFPVGTLATITRVVCSPDFEHARVWVSVLPNEQADETLTILNAALGELQHLLIQKLAMDPIPKIRFLLDDSERRASEIEGLLDTLEHPE